MWFKLATIPFNSILFHTISSIPFHSIRFLVILYDYSAWFVSFLQACKKTCFQRELIGECGCYDPNYPFDVNGTIKAFESIPKLSQVKPCTVSNYSDQFSEWGYIYVLWDYIMCLVGLHYDMCLLGLLIVVSKWLLHFVFMQWHSRPYFTFAGSCVAEVELKYVNNTLGCNEACPVPC